MGSMVRSKRSFICKECRKPHMKWAGFCSGCRAIGTLEEQSTGPEKPKATQDQRSIIRRSKKSERTIARSMQDVDGPDPNFRRIASSTGRVGHITSLQFDAVSRSYVTENKNRSLPGWLIKAWVQINQLAVNYHKDVLLHIEPPNMPKTFLVNGENHKLSTLAVITQAHHEDLIKRSRLMASIEQAFMESTSTVDLGERVAQLLKES